MVHAIVGKNVRRYILCEIEGGYKKFLCEVTQQQSADYLALTDQLLHEAEGLIAAGATVFSELKTWAIQRKAELLDK